jgi:hypothetical protein
MKHPNWKPAFFLSATVLTLGSFTYWLQFSHKPKKEREDALLKKPLSFKAESIQISGFRIKSSSGVIEGKCESLAQKTCKVGSTAEWSLLYPEKLKGDSARIRDYLNNASGMSSTETLDLSEESEEKRSKLLDEYGLSDSKRTSMNASFIELTLEDGKKVTAWFGDTHPIGDKIFVASAENGVLNAKTIFLIANFYRNSLFEKNLTYFRDKNLFNFDRANFESFEIKGTHEKLSAKRVNGLWEINGMDADHDRVETVLSSVAQAEAKDFVDETALKGTKTELTFKGRMKDGSEVSFSLHSKSEGKKEDSKKSLYLKSSSLKSPVEIEPGFQVSVDKTLNHLRRNLLILASQKVTTSQIKLEGKNFAPAAEFTFDGKSWNEKAGGPKMDVAKVPSLIDQLSSVHSPEIVSPAPKAADDSVVLTLGTREKSDLYRYQLYEVKNKAYARDLNSKRNEAFLLDEGLKKAFPFRPESWKMGK